MLAVARRAPLASGTAVAWVAASRRRSVWSPVMLHTGRWLSTTAGGGNGQDDTTTRNKNDAATTRETPAQKNAREFALLPALLRVYEKHVGHRVVPRHFAIPPTDETPSTKVRKKPTRVFGLVSDVREIPWPDEARGMNFGSVFNKFVTNSKYYETYPSIADAMEEMGMPLGDAYRAFVWDQLTMAALRTFYRIHGHTLLSPHFKVPRGDTQWPVATWGYYLGIRVSTLRRSKHQLNETELADLERVEFSFNVAETMWSEQILPSFETYVRVYGDCLIPRAFEVPRAAPWPRKAWGLLLGSVVTNMRFRGDYAAQIERDRQRLEAMGFVWDVSEHKWSNVIFPSLETFANQFGHCDVPRMFVVPSELPWPEEAWGLRLGDIVGNMRSQSIYAAEVRQDASRLEAIGFVWKHHEHQYTHRFLPAIETFHQLHGHTRVPTKFVVPSESPWPEKVWGLQLGPMIDSMRRDGTYSEYVERDAARLAAIGFTTERRSVNTK